MILVKDLQATLGNRHILNGVDFAVDAGEIIAIIGSSGCGKSTLLRHLMLLCTPAAGELKLFGTTVDFTNEAQLNSLRRRMGVLFQQGALLSGMSVIENIDFVLQEYTSYSPAIRQELALMKILMVGLEPHAAHKMPNELSGGMQKRAALARALALDPALLLLDEPTAGLDPQSSGAFDELILQLRASLGLTIMLVTHDVDSLQHIADRILYLSAGKVLSFAPYEQLKQNAHPEIQAYFARSQRSNTHATRNNGTRGL